MLRQRLAHVVEVVWRIADAKGRRGVRGDCAAGKVLARACCLRRLQRLLKVLRGSLMHVDQLATQTGLRRLLGRTPLALRQRDARFLSDRAHRFRKADVFQLLHKGEDIALLVAAETIEVVVLSIDAERRRLLLVERAQARVVLRTALAQTHVLADHLDDVGGLFDGLCEVVSHDGKARRADF